MPKQSMVYDPVAKRFKPGPAGTTYYSGSIPSNLTVKGMLPELTAYAKEFNKLGITMPTTLWEGKALTVLNDGAVVAGGRTTMARYYHRRGRGEIEPDSIPREVFYRILTNARTKAEKANKEIDQVFSAHAEIVAASALDGADKTGMLDSIVVHYESKIRRLFTNVFTRERIDVMINYPIGITHSTEHVRIYRENIQLYVSLPSMNKFKDKIQFIKDGQKTYEYIEKLRKEVFK